MDRTFGTRGILGDWLVTIPVRDGETRDIWGRLFLECTGSGPYFGTGPGLKLDLSWNWLFLGRGSGAGSGWGFCLDQANLRFRGPEPMDTLLWTG